MKPCKTCNIEKPLSSFYVHKAMSDGYLNICKNCTKVRVAKHRELNISHIKEYDKKRALTPKRVEARKQYSKTEAGKNSHAKSIKKYREKHTDRYFAYIVFANAVKDGKVIKTPCFICGDINSEGHHPDYSRPLDVVWLCKKHHVEAHKLTKEYQ